LAHGFLRRIILLSHGRVRPQMQAPASASLAAAFDNWQLSSMLPGASSSLALPFSSSTNTNPSAPMQCDRIYHNPKACPPHSLQPIFAPDTDAPSNAELRRQSSLSAKCSLKPPVHQVEHEASCNDSLAYCNAVHIGTGQHNFPLFRLQNDELVTVPSMRGPANIVPRQPSMPGRQSNCTVTIQCIRLDQASAFYYPDPCNMVPLCRWHKPRQHAAICIH
jgi:hypothetical protein